MTQKNKDLLLQDLCARLPYGVKVKVEYYDDAWNICSINPNGVTFVTKYTGYPIETNWENCKPYLFPLSSMTEEQKNQLKELWSTDMDKAIDYSISGEDELCDLCQLSAAKKVTDWLIANHFDYRGLIPKGLAEDATNKNIY